MECDRTGLGFMSSMKVFDCILTITNKKPSTNNYSYKMKTSPAREQRNDLRQPQCVGPEQAVAAMEWLVVERPSLEGSRATEQPVRRTALRLGV